MSKSFDKESYRKNGFTDEEIHHIEKSLLDFEKTDISYSHDEVFSTLRKRQDKYRAEYV